MKSSSVRINVAIIPDKRVTSRAIRMSAALKKKGGLFVLGKTRHPHVTVYMSDFPRTQVRRIPKLLTTMFVSTIHMRAFSYVVKKDGYVEVQFKVTPALRTMQQKIITALNPLRGGSVAHKEVFAKFSHRAKINTKRFGYPAIGAAFHPHISFTRFKTAPKGLPLTTPITNFSFTAKELGVYVVGSHGTCKKLLKKISL
ncbi:MAG: hypothetical protein AAB449_00130 [Patescibacteria group bacterium]